MAIFDKLISASTRLPVKKNKKESARPSGLNVIVSRSHMTDDTEAFLDKLEKKYKKINQLSIGSSIKLCAIAEGKADIYPRFAPTMEWDTAAGQSIIEQAGGYFAQADTYKAFVYNKQNLLNPWFIAAGDKTLIDV